MLHTYAPQLAMVPSPSRAFHVLLRSAVVALTAFLTVVDLFATQAILPSLARHYEVTPAAMSFAVNASTMGMAIGALLVAVTSQRIERRTGILVSLALLSIPTALLAIAPNLNIFTLLRVMQGLCMSSAFALTLAYLGEQCSTADSGGAFAAYITGNVASNLIGRLISAGVTDTLGIATNFYLFAILNLTGAVLVYFTVHRAEPMRGAKPTNNAPLLALAAHLRNHGLRSAFICGFCILFAFIGTFSYVNFVLVRPPLSLDMMQVGFVYLVFLPSIATTLLAGAAVRQFGTRLSLAIGVVIAATGLPLLLWSSLGPVLLGLALIALGTFFAQAVATGYVGRNATESRGVASGFYLSSYFLGGLVGSALLGQLFDRLGWGVCVSGVGAALLVICKRACLRYCQNPVLFLSRNWRPGTLGALRMGLRHGIYCVGCCWFLMGLLFVTGIMNLLWIAAIALYVAVEKLLPIGRRLSLAAGFALTLSGVMVLVRHAI
jgi:YNFM family putative membrane transporter